MSNSNVIIRRARKDDCPSMMALIQELAVFEKAPQEVTVTIEHFEDCGFGEHPVWWAFVAEVDETVVGMALYYIRYSTWKGKRLYLEDYVVTEKMRGKGIGVLLFDQIITEAKEKNFIGVNWQVLNWNQPAIEFYKKYKTEFDDEWLNCKINFY